jgi:flavin reductase (DIM6/NTAB) family NADH-FMN oxidoreductase RutF
MNIAYGGILNAARLQINIGVRHKTSDNIRLRKEFTVGIADKANLVPADYVGIVSGHDTDDKIAKTGWTVVKSENVDAPVFEELPITLECRVEEINQYDQTLRIVAEIVNTIVDDSVLDEEGNEPEGNARYVKNYTMAEAPGFWLNAEGRNSGHGDKSVFGLSVGNAKPGQISMIQMPDLCSVGDVYKAEVFFVNEETGAMVTINLVYSIVDEVVDYETVGTESIVLPLADKDSFAAIDLTKAAEALGVSVDDLLNDDNKYLHGITDSGIFGGGFSAADGIVYNEQGFFDLANGSIILTIGQEGGNATAATYSNDAVADDYSLSTQMCFRIDNKQYIYDVKFISAAAYATAVTAVKRSQPMSGTAYDLQGRKIENRKSVNRKLARGLYIIDGKKTLVK